MLLPTLVLFLILNLLAGLWRIYQGPTSADRMLSALLFGSTTVAILLLLAEWQQIPALQVAALILAMLAAVISLVFVATQQSARGAADDGAQR